MAMHLPTFVDKIKLEGTPAQVKWAKQIRTKRAVTMQKCGIRMLLLAIKPHINEEALQAMNCISRKNILRFAHGVAMHMISCPKARWWIDNRDALPYHNIQTSVEAAIAHYTRIKTFK